MTVQDAALADLAEAVGRALVRYAKAVRETAPGTQASGSPASESRALPRGARQRAVLGLAELANGMTAQEVAAGADLLPSNVYGVLRALVDAGWLEELDEEPRRWRTRSSA